MNGIFGERGSKQTMTVSAQAILAYLQLAPWNNDDWKEVHPRSGIKERNEYRRMDESSLAGQIRMDMTGSV